MKLARSAGACTLGLAAFLSAAAPTVLSSDENESRARFRDVTAASGIDFVHTNGRAGELFVIEVKGSGVAFLDYDDDGDLDLYAVNGNNLPGATTESPPINHLYRNEGDGTFFDVTETAGVGDGGYGHGIAVADYDNDGDQDIFIANYGPNVLYRNDGNETFTETTDVAGVAGNVWSASAAFCDVDQDGLLDLYVANYLVFDIESTVRLPNGPGFYDGELDVLYLNNGDGTFRDVTQDAIGEPRGKGLGVVCFDYDEDGDLDLYVANDGVENLMYENDGNGTFEDVTLFSGTGVNGAGKTQAGMGVDAGDYDNDGDMDLFVTNYKGDSNTLMRNDGGGIFTDTTSQANLLTPSLPYVSFGTGFFDPDNDGDLDLYVANGHTEEYEPDHEQPDQMFENLGNGKFEDASNLYGAPFSSRYVGRGVAFGDFDNDGDIDLAVSNKNGPLNLLQNVGGDSRNWLVVKTIGTKSNRDGIGSRIEITASGFSRIKDVKSGYSIFSASDPRVHFGLGDLESVDVEIHWPSGAVDTVTDVPANRLLTVSEGSGRGSVTELRPIDTAYGDDVQPMSSSTTWDMDVLEDTNQRLRAMMVDGSDDINPYLSMSAMTLAWITERTLERFEALSSAEPENGDYLNEYGMYLQSIGRLTDAIEVFERAAQLRPDSAALNARLASLFLRAGRPRDAEASAARAIDLGDDSPLLLLQYAESLAAEQSVKAELVLLEVLARDPRSIQGRVQLADLYAEAGRTIEARDEYRAAVRLGPGSREIRYQLAEACRRLGDEDAYEYHMRIFELLEVESAVFKGGMPRDEEIEILHREIRMNPLFGRTRADRQLALRHGELEDASNRDLFSLRARASTLKDDMASRIDGMRRLVELDSSPSTRAMFEDTNTFRMRLVASLNRGTDYDPKEASGLVEQGNEALVARRFDEALTAFRAALLRDPDGAAAYRGLARVYVSGQLGLGPARALARRAALIDQSAESYLLLADVLDALGDDAGAKRASRIAALQTAATQH